MGKRDYRQREKKKTKKDEKKAPAITTTVRPAPGPVEVIKRGKKEQPEG